jgi:glutaredoxin
MILTSQLQDVGISRKRHAALELFISNVVTQAQVPYLLLQTLNII